MPKVLITQRIFPQIAETLSDVCKVVALDNPLPLSPQKLVQKARDTDAIFCQLTDKFDAKTIESFPRLKIIANMAVGYNNIDVEAATKRGILVTNTPGILTEATADLTWALILAVTRRIPEADTFTRAGKFKIWQYDLFLGSELSGRTLGIAGFGRIGQAVARRAAGFGMNVIYFSSSRREEAEAETGAQKVDLGALLKRSDILSLHVPLTAATKYLIGAKELSQMKKTAYLINTARGPVVDEKALVDALKKKVIAGAGLDVYENEPKLAPNLAKLPNTVLLPHIASATVETRTKMANTAAANLVAFFRGKTPPNCINPQVLQK